jgi:PAS domain S-box-containing protein
MKLWQKVAGIAAVYGSGVMLLRIVLFGQGSSPFMFTAVSIIGGILLIFILLRQVIVHPMEQLADVLEAVGNGDMDVVIPSDMADRTDEIGQVAQTLDQLLKSLKIAVMRNEDAESADIERIWMDAKYMQTALDEAPIGITISDPSQDDNPIIYTNEGIQAVTGYPEEEIVGQNCRFLQGEATDPETVATLRKAIDNREEVAVEIRNYRKNGEMFWNRLRLQPVINNGDLEYFIGFQNDLTRF